MLAIGSGGLIGLTLGATGGGGALLAIPLLVYVLGVTARDATAMSLMVVGGSALLGVWDYGRAGEVRVKAALVFSGTGAVGAWGGAYAHQLVREDLLLVLFGMLMLGAAAKMLRKASAMRCRPMSSPASRCAPGCMTSPLMPSRAQRSISSMKAATERVRFSPSGAARLMR